MNALAHADAVRPKPVVVLNLLLRPFSIGHELILLRQRNPLAIFREDSFAQLSPTEQVQALVDAVLICCQSWNENNSMAADWFLGWKLKIWHWRNRHADFPAEIARFRRYRDEGSTCPPIPTFPPDDTPGQGAGGPRCLGSPELALLLNFSSNHSNLFAVETPYDAPLGFAIWQYRADCELAGSMKVENSYEAQGRMEIEQHEADFAREQAEKRLAELEAEKNKTEGECPV